MRVISQDGCYDIPYEQAGNGVTVNVIEAIARNMKIEEA